MKIEHNEETNAARDQCPKLIAIVATCSIPKVICDCLVPFHEGDAGKEDKKSCSKRANTKFILHIPIIPLRPEGIYDKIYNVLLRNAGVYLLKLDTYGALAQLARAPALQAGGPGFESPTLHHMG